MLVATHCSVGAGTASRLRNTTLRARINFTLWLAIALLAITALVHLIDMPDAFEEVTYKGLLFLANGIGGLIAAGAILAGRRWGWWLGMVVTSGALLGYIASRTIGLPGLPAEPDAWLEPLGLISLFAEGLFLALATRHLAAPSQAIHATPVNAER